MFLSLTAYWMNPAMHQIMCWMGWTCLMELIVITSTLAHVDIIGCGILASSIMEAGKYVLSLQTSKERRRKKEGGGGGGRGIFLYFFFFLSYNEHGLVLACNIGTKVSSIERKMVVGRIQVWWVQIWWCDVNDVHSPRAAGMTYMYRECARVSWCGLMSGLMVLFRLWKLCLTRMGHNTYTTEINFDTGYLNFLKCDLNYLWLQKNGYISVVDG